jgi:phospholipase C
LNVANTVSGESLTWSDEVKKRAMLGCLAAVAVVTNGVQAAELGFDNLPIPIEHPFPIIPPFPVPVIPNPLSSAAFPTRTPIKHLVVIFGENRSFDHYFATYPNAQNNVGETPFRASPFTPVANNLMTPLNPEDNFRPIRNLDLLGNNPNGPHGTGASVNGANASNPFRLGPTKAWTTGNNHGYTAEQEAYDNGKLDLFPANTGEAGAIGNACNPNVAGDPGCQLINQSITMAYFDGNTVMAWWNLAQHFALNDNTFTSMFGPSTPGALNLISGQTNGFLAQIANSASGLVATSNDVADGHGNFTDIGDIDPLGDPCSSTTSAVRLDGTNIGDLLNQRNVTWGWFAGGFNLSIKNSNGTTGCARSTQLVGNPNLTEADYVPHHTPFQYYPSTSNLTHARPSSIASIGHSKIPGTNTPEPANHNYDVQDFFAALSAGNLPAVSFLKAPSFQDSHPSNSDPIDEQNFIIQVMNALQQSPEWRDTAVILTYDDSDGWYDHQMPAIVNPSKTASDQLNGSGVCDSSNGNQQNRPATPTTPLPGVAGLPVQGRCGYGTRIPFLVASPFAKVNFIDHTLLDQSSVIRFIEDNWLSGQRIPGSFDAMAGTLDNMFEFALPIGLAPKVFFAPNGTVTNQSTAAQ